MSCNTFVKIPHLIFKYPNTAATIVPKKTNTAIAPFPFDISSESFETLLLSF